MPNELQTGEELWQFARENGLQAVAALLRKHVEDGQPDNFMPGYTSRAMCRIASRGIEGKPDDPEVVSYLDTKYGVDLYWCMWGGSSLPEEEPEIEQPVVPVPCPFCGKEAKLEVENDHHGETFNLGCSDQDCIAYHLLYTIDTEEMSVEDGIRAWNSRNLTNPVLEELLSKYSLPPEAADVVDRNFGDLLA